MASLIFLFFTQVFALNHPLDGLWRFEDPNGKQPKILELNVSVQKDLLNLMECSIGLTSPSEECIESQYELRNESDVWDRLTQRKIGNVYPFRILVYQSNSQVSELIKLNLVKEDILEYVYSYSNMDGEAVYRSAILQHVTQ